MMTTEHGNQGGEPGSGGGGGGHEGRGGPGGHDEIRIIVNARPKVVTHPVLSFDEVVLLAFDPVPSGPNITITVTYRNAVAPMHSGTLSEGQTVTVHNGTIFNVTVTDKS